MVVAEAMECELQKAVDILDGFIFPKSHPIIPPSVLNAAKGIAIFS